MAKLPARNRAAALDLKFCLRSLRTLTTLRALMFNKLLTGLIAAVTVGLLSTAALADSPHFIRGPTPAFDTSTGDLCVTFKEAGLGNTPITYTLTVDSATFTFQCFTRHGNEPQGDPNNVSFSDLFASTTITPHNGQITGSLCLEPQQGDAGCQGGGLILKLTAALYSAGTFCDATNNICIDIGEQGGNVVPPVVFGGGHGH